MTTQKNNTLQNGNIMTKVLIGLALVAVAAGITYGIIRVIEVTKEASTETSQQSTKTADGRYVVPSNWKRTTTETGVSVALPPEWNVLFESQSEFMDLRTKSSSYGASGSIEAPKSAALGDRLVVAAGTSTLTANNIQDIMYAKLKDADYGAKSSKMVKVNEKEWLQIASKDGTTSLYQWNNDKVVLLKWQTPSGASESDVTTKYIYPVASSLKL